MEIAERDKLGQEIRELVLSEYEKHISEIASQDTFDQMKDSLEKAISKLKADAIAKITSNDGVSIDCVVQFPEVSFDWHVGPA